MTRKECDNNFPTASAGRSGPTPAPRHDWIRRLIALTALVFAACPTGALGGSVRMWPGAVVVADSIRLDDLCELTGFDASSEQMIAGLVVADAPAAGGSRVIHIDMVRTALSAGGANMAQLTLRGATQCEVSRPSQALAEPRTTPRSGTVAGSASPPVGSTRTLVNGRSLLAHRPTSLRAAVIEHFDSELARYGGTADVTFDRTSEQVLDLSGPTYDFRIRRRNSSPLGLVSLEVDVLAGGRTVQTLPLVVQVSMTARVVLARRTINQGATIRDDDVELVPLSFDRLDDSNLDSTARAVGQRAKRVITAGRIIDPGMLEPVPLVLRGQLVTLTSASGAIRAVTTVKAAGTGLLGETIKVRTVDDQRAELDAVVTGPGRVQIGGATPRHGETALANRGSF